MSIDNKLKPLTTEQTKHLESELSGFWSIAILHYKDRLKYYASHKRVISLYNELGERGYDTSLYTRRIADVSRKFSEPNSYIG